MTKSAYPSPPVPALTKSARASNLGEIRTANAVVARLGPNTTPFSDNRPPNGATFWAKKGQLSELRIGES